MPAKSKERLHQLFVQHTHSNCPKQVCKGRVQAVWSAWSRSDRRRGYGVVLSVEVTPGSPVASCASDNRLALVVAVLERQQGGDLRQKSWTSTRIAIPRWPRNAYGPRPAWWGFGNG